ncbi:MAG: hypothetical protein CMK46_00710 [Porticoccus sp.]|nr:hypothetical protein [Porticoccus sp.]|tara:strand:- start:14547 stop:14855 length:309 start_codon:yes stop_codon:yes gene_type:complete
MNKQEHSTIKAIKAANEIKVQNLIEQMTIRANLDARKQAKLEEDNTYLGTRFSKEGHGAIRKTYNGVCRECHRIQNLAYRARNKAELAELRAIVCGREAADC